MQAHTFEPPVSDSHPSSSISHVPANPELYIPAVMTTPADLINGIDHLISAINGTCGFINSIEEPPQDAEDVKNVLVSAKAKLSALRTRIMTQHRSDEFNRKWGDSAQKVLDYMRLTIGKMNAKLKVNQSGGDIYDLRRSGKNSWPFSAEDTLTIHKQLNEFAAMLAGVNNSFLSDSIPEVSRTSKVIDRSIRKTQTYRDPTAESQKSSSTNLKGLDRSSRPRSFHPSTWGKSSFKDQEDRKVRREASKEKLASTVPRRTLTRSKTIRAGATLTNTDLEKLRVDLKGLQIGPLYPDATLVPKTRGTLASNWDLGKGILELFFSRSAGKVLAVYKNMHGNLQTITWDVHNIKFNPMDQIVKTVFSRNPKHSKAQLPFRFYLRLYGTPRILRGPKDASALKNADTVTFYFESKAADNWKNIEINETEVRDSIEREWHYMMTTGLQREANLYRDAHYS